MSTRYCLLFVCLILPLLGCGQKGPLYLPETSPEVATEVAEDISEDASLDASEDEDDES